MEFEERDFSSLSFLFDFNTEVGEFVDLLDRRFDDPLVQRFKGGIFIRGHAHQFSELFERDEGGLALIASGIEIVETEFPEDEGVICA